MNDSQLRELLHDTQPPAFDASGVADGARRVAIRRGRAQRAVLGGVTGVAVMAVGFPLASQIFGDGIMSDTAASQADNAKGGGAPELAGAPTTAGPVTVSDQSTLDGACAAPSAPSRLAGPADLIGLVVCGPTGPHELSTSDFAVVRGDLRQEEEEAPASGLDLDELTVLGRLASGDLVFLRLSDGRLDFGTETFALGAEATRILEAAGR